MGGSPGKTDAHEKTRGFFPARAARRRRGGGTSCFAWDRGGWTEHREGQLGKVPLPSQTMGRCAPMLHPGERRVPAATRAGGSARLGRGSAGRLVQQPRGISRNARLSRSLQGGKGAEARCSKRVCVSRRQGDKFLHALYQLRDEYVSLTLGSAGEKPGGAVTQSRDTGFPCGLPRRVCVHRALFAAIFGHAPPRRTSQCGIC